MPDFLNQQNCDGSTLYTSFHSLRIPPIRPLFILFPASLLLFCPPTPSSLREEKLLSRHPSPPNVAVSLRLPSPHQHHPTPGGHLETRTREDVLHALRQPHRPGTDLSALSVYNTTEPDATQPSHNHPQGRLLTRHSHVVLQYRPCDFLACPAPGTHPAAPPPSFHASLLLFNARQPTDAFGRCRVVFTNPCTVWGTKKAVMRI